MSILPLVQLTKYKFNDKSSNLWKPCQEVTDFGEDFQKIVDDLLETFKSHKIAVGLAAPQIGVQFKVSVINIQKDKVEPTLIIVNPKIVSEAGKKDKKKEACMSLPYYQGEVERRSKITISYQDRFGQIHNLNAEGFLARVLCHEIDHLEGVLYIHRMQSQSTLERADFFDED